MKDPRITEEISKMELTLPDGTKTMIDAKTIYTYREDGTNDCTIILNKPLQMGSSQVKI